MNKRQALLLAAEDRVRTGGYDNFSFRDLASDVGIKSASVHYHFPTKASLGVALVQDYTDRFMASLPDNQSGEHTCQSLLSAFIQHFRAALVDEQKMCLCGLLGAETDGLPADVKAATRDFFSRILEWLTDTYSRAPDTSIKVASAQAKVLVAALEGALIVSKVIDDNDVFERVAETFLPTK